MSAIRFLTRARPTVLRANRHTQKRRIADGLNNKPNEMTGQQVHYQQNPHLHGADNPTYLKGKGDGAVNVASAVLFFTSAALMMRGHYKMANGKKK